MPRNFKVYFEDILTAIQKIETYTQGMSFEVFIEDSRTFDAVIRNFEIIGEAVKNIPPEIRSNNPNIEWKKIASFRDVLAHEYFGLDPDLIWEVIHNHLGELKSQVLKLKASDE